MCLGFDPVDPRARREAILQDDSNISDVDVTAVPEDAAENASQALKEPTARRRQGNILGLVGSLDWENGYDYKVGRSRN